MRVAQLMPVVTALAPGQREFVHHASDGSVLRRDDGIILTCVEVADARPTDAGGQPSPGHRRTSLFAARAMVVFGAVLAAALALAGLRGWITVRVRLRHRLIGQFTLAGGIPLLVLLATAVFDRSDRIAVLVDRFSRRDIDTLGRVDDDLPGEFAPLIRRYEQALRLAARLPTRAIAPALAPLQRWAEAHPRTVNRLGMVDREGRTLLMAVGRLDVGRQRATFIEGYAALCHEVLRVCNGRGDDAAAPDADGPAGTQPTGARSRSPQRRSIERTATPPRSGGQVRTTAQLMIGLKHDDWIRDLGQLRRSMMGDEAVFGYACGIPDGAGGYRALFMAMHPAGHAQVRYLDRTIQRRRRLGPAAPRLAALPVSLGGGRPCYPTAAAGRDPTLRRFRDLLLATRMPQSLQGRVGRHRVLLSGVAGRNLDGYALILARPMADIEMAVASLDWRLAMFTAAMLCVTGLAGTLVAQWLLQPIADLDRGLARLRERDYRHPVPPGPITELAAVAQRLNLVMDDLLDRQTALRVQDQQRPNGMTVGTGWRLAGWRRTPPGLASSFFDWFDTPRGLAIMVGDVAGQGIASALVAAEARIDLALGLESGASPAAVLADLNQRFIARFERLRPMSVWIGVFCTHTGQLEYGNAGYCWPVLLLPATADHAAANGGRRESPGATLPARTAWLDLAGPPLGASRRRPPAGATVRLAPGARVVIPSRSLIESRNAAGEPFGHARWRDAVLTIGIGANLRALAQPATFPAPNRLLARLLGVIRRWEQRAEPTDERTLVVLARDPARAATGDVEQR